MLLSDIKHYLLNRRRASLEDLALHFDTDTEAVRGMLAQWIRKGRVVKLDAVSPCGGSCKGCCGRSTPEIYEWLN